MVITFQALADPVVPLKENVVRLTRVSGQIVIEYVDRESTRGSYQMKMDFGGAIPAWLSNALCREIPYRSLTGIVKQARNRKYIEAGQRSGYRAAIEEQIQKGNLKSSFKDPGPSYRAPPGPGSK